MQIKFPGEQIPDHLVVSQYTMSIDMHMYYEKMHMKYELSIVKYAGFFLLASFGFRWMEGKELIDTYLLPVAWLGCLLLFVSFMRMLFISSDIDQKRAFFEKKGLDLEERYSQIVVNSRYFQVLEKLKSNHFMSAVLCRLVPFGFIGAITILAAVTLSAKLSSNFAVWMGISSSIILFTATGYLAKKIRKAQRNYEYSSFR